MPVKQTSCLKLLTYLSYTLTQVELDQLMIISIPCTKSKTLHRFVNVLSVNHKAILSIQLAFSCDSTCIKRLHLSDYSTSRETVSIHSFNYAYINMNMAHEENNPHSPELLRFTWNMKADVIKIMQSTYSSREEIFAFVARSGHTSITSLTCFNLE